MKECWRLIRAVSLGRLAITGREGAPDIFPLNYKVHGGSIYFRSAPGSKLAAIATHPVAALEIDGKEAGFLWNVDVRGTMRRLVTDQEIRDSGVKRLVSSSPTPKDNYVRIETSSVSVRRFLDGSCWVPPPANRDRQASYGRSGADSVRRRHCGASAPQLVQSTSSSADPALASVLKTVVVRTKPPAERRRVERLRVKRLSPAFCGCPQHDLPDLVIPEHDGSECDARPPMGEV